MLGWVRETALTCPPVTYDQVGGPWRLSRVAGARSAGRTIAGMDEQGLLDRIERWQAAGLIDAVTADRLRAAEAGGPADGAPTADGPGEPAAAPSPLSVPAAVQPRAVTATNGSTAAAVFGPSITVVEMFAYLGRAFLLAAVIAFFARLASDSAGTSSTILGIGAAVVAIALTVIGLVLRTGTPRRRRAAGIAFLVAVLAAGSAISLFGGTVVFDGLVLAVLSTGAALAVALAFRLVLPAMTTELAVLGSITALSSTLLVWIASVGLPTSFAPESVPTPTPPPGPDPLILVFGAAIWWLATAFLLGIFGLLEAYRGRRDPGAQRRAGVVRLWAGLTAVLGLFYAVSQSTYSAVSGSGRRLEPVIGDVAVLVVAAILLERAYRRESNAYVVAAAVGCILALSDLDVSYLAGPPDVALLLEGLILIIVGLGAEMLRRRLAGLPAG